MSDDQDTMDEWAAALAEAEGPDDSGEAHVAELDELSDSKHEMSGDEKRKLDTILDIPVTISMEVGEPLDVLVNGTLIAHGEVVVVNDKFGIRLTDVISQVERIKKLR